MNILVLTSEYPYEKYPRPDWTAVIAYFSREWVKQGHRVIVIVNSSYFPNAVYSVAKLFPKIATKILDISLGSLGKSEWSSEFSFQDQGVEVFNLPIQKLLPGGKYRKHVLDIQVERIDKVLKKHEFLPDVVTGHWINPQLFLLTNIKEMYNCESAFVFHADYVENRCRKFGVDKYINKIDHVGCRSRYAANRIEQYLPLKERPFICCSGIPDEYVITEDSFQHKFEDNRMVIVSAGRMVRYKNFEQLIYACQEAFPQKNFRLSIFGEGILKAKLEKIIRRLNLDDCIFLPGKVSRIALQNEMERANVFALISNNETLGLVYIEAMAKGCIVIGSKDSGIDGIIIDGKNGFLCEQGSITELETTLKRIDMLSVEKKLAISKNAIDTARELTNKKMAEKYLKNII